MWTLVTNLAPALSGLLLGMFNASKERDLEKHRMELELRGLAARETEAARAMQGPGIQFTRRLIVCSFVASLVVIPALFSLIYPDKLISVPRSVVEGRFLFFEGHEVVEYIKVQGMVLVMPLIDMLGIMVGYYFGARR